MRGLLRFWLFWVILFISTSLLGQIRDGGIDPWNLGKGDWLYSVADATNKLGNHVSSVTNENSLMLFYKSQGIRYMIVKAATSDFLFKGCYNFPQFNSNLVNIAHANGILIFGYNRSYGSNVLGEIAIADYVFNQGADGFVFDAEAEWEQSAPWIGSSGPAKAWQLCSAVRSNWPTKFLAHAPFPIIYLHSSFPYKEFGYWCDAAMPQIYHFSATKGSQSAAINWSDVNWQRWHASLYNLAPTNINGLTVYWTNAIKPLAPINNVYGPRGSSPCEGLADPFPDVHVQEFMDYLLADPYAQSPGGYRGVSFWRADLHGPVQWSYIQSGTSGTFPGVVNNLVLDNLSATTSGGWTTVRTWNNTSTAATFIGNGSGTDINSFGTNYLTHGPGSGSSFVQFTATIATTGNYDVYQWHAVVTNAATNVAFIINHAEGTNTVLANQQTNGGNWTLLGRFPFAAGASANVRITDTFAQPGAVAIADGIKFAYAGALPTLPPAAPSGLAATAVSTSRVDLVWIDNATNETSFVIARGIISGGPYTDLTNLPPNTTAFTDNTAAANTMYYYVARAINLGGSSTNSAEASALTPAVPPTIISQPQDQSALFGQSPVFTVSVSGSTPLAYQWRFNGENISGATNSTLTVASATLANSGSYSVLVTNNGGVALSSNAQLSVLLLAALGDNSFGQAAPPLNATGLVAIAAGAWHSLALRSDGSVLAWGNNDSGQTAVPPSLTNVLALAAGGYHNLAITANGGVAGWGDNTYSQSAIPAGATGVVAIAAGRWHSLALRMDGKVVAWGDNSSGQTKVPSDLTNAVAIAAGAYHSLALRDNGTVAAWGDNLDAQGFFAGQSMPPAGTSQIVAISAGDFHSVAVATDGAITVWGDNSQNQSSPHPNLIGSNRVVSVSAGAAHNLALSANGTVTSWGANWSGECNLPSPLSNAIAVAAGGSHSLVLLEDSHFAPRIHNPVKSGSRFTALLQTLNRKTYAIEFKDFLLQTNWTALSTNTGNGALRLLLDPSASSSGRFYRARQW